jgi:AraC-like DNA-binding protein
VSPRRIVKRESDITRMAFPFELLHARGPATNMHWFHWHEFVEISFVRAGTGTYEIEDKTFTVQPGDIVIINNSERHRVTYDPARPLHETVLHFSAGLLEGPRTPGEARGQGLPLFSYDGPVFVNKPELSPVARRAVRSLVAGIGREWERREPWFQAVIRARLVQLACLLLRAQGSREPESASVRAARRKKLATMRQVLDWIRANYRRQVSLSEIAARFSMRGSYFSDFFRRAFGVTFTRYLRQLRVEEAARAIAQEGRGSEEAAIASGFSSRTSFHRAFRQVMGASPGDWVARAAGRAVPESKKTAH